MKPYLKTHDIIDSIDGFSHIGLNYNRLPPIRIKTKPSIFILKRKPNIKYDPNKTGISVQNFPEQIGNTENMELNISHEITQETKPIFADIVESLKEFGEPVESGKQNFSNVEPEETKKTNNNIEEEVKLVGNFTNDNISTENILIENKNNLLLNLKNKKEEEEKGDSRKIFENVSNIDNTKLDERIRLTIEDRKIIKERTKNHLNPRQEGHKIKETVKKIIQKKMQEAKQRREINDERGNVEFSIKPTKKEENVATELSRRTRPLEQKLKETTPADKITVIEESKIAKESTKDGNEDKQFIKAKSITQAADKLESAKVVSLEQPEKKEDADTTTIEKVVESKVNEQVSVTEGKIMERESRENVKTSKPINIRENIRDIINQFKEFEKDFVLDDNTEARMSDARTKSDVTETDNELDRSARKEDRPGLRDPKESLKEIIDQFKYIKHELTSEEDDQFDEIAAKYMERPIAETLLQFNEALKTLMQRRRKILSYEDAINVYNGKDDYDALANRRKLGETEQATATRRVEKTITIEHNYGNEKAKIDKSRNNGANNVDALEGKFTEKYRK